MGLCCNIIHRQISNEAGYLEIWMKLRKCKRYKILEGERSSSVLELLERNGRGGRGFSLWRSGVRVEHRRIRQRATPEEEWDWDRTRVNYAWDSRPSSPSVPSVFPSFSRSIAAAYSLIFLPFPVIIRNLVVGRGSGTREEEKGDGPSDLRRIKLLWQVHCTSKRTLWFTNVGLSTWVISLG